MLPESSIVTLDPLTDQGSFTTSNSVIFNPGRRYINLSLEEYEALLEENSQLKQECIRLQKRIHKLEDDAFAAACT